MKAAKALLLALADPILETELLDLPEVTVHPSSAELPAECLEQLSAQTYQAVLLSPALAPLPGALPALVASIRRLYPQIELAILTTADDADSRQTGATLLTTQPARDAVLLWLQGGGSARPAQAPPRTAVPVPAAPVPAARTPVAPAAMSGDRTPNAALPPSPHPQVLRQRVAAFWGGKGGTGRSTLVTAVADILSRITGVRVCTVDLCAANSSLAPLLRKEGEPNSWLTLSEALLKGALTAQTVRSALLPVTERWSLLTGPAGHPQWSALMTPHTVSDLVEALKTDYDYILLDLPAGRSPVGDAALESAQLVMLLVSAFYPDVLETTRTLERLRDEGIITPDRCRLVLSPWVDAPELPAADVGACLALPVAARIPLCAQAALAAARSGQPVTRIGHPEARAISDGAASVAALISEAATNPQRRRLWFSKSS